MEKRGLGITGQLAILVGGELQPGDIMATADCLRISGVFSRVRPPPYGTENKQSFEDNLEDQDVCRFRKRVMAGHFLSPGEGSKRPLILCS